MGFLNKLVGFVVRPTHSRTMGILVFLVLTTAVGLTVYIAQQQQTLRQRADLNCPSRTTQTDCQNAGCLWEEVIEESIFVCSTPPQTSICDINQQPWTSSGGCGDQGCPQGQVPQFRSCLGGLAKNRCQPDASCPQPATPTSPLTVSSSFSCEGIHRISGTQDQKNFQCQTRSCTDGWFSLATPSTCRAGTVCCFQEVSAVAPPAPTPIPQLIQCSIDTEEGQFRCRPNCFLGEIVVGGSTTCSLDKTKPLCCLNRSKRLPTPTPIPTSQCGVNDCGGAGACAENSTCAQVGSGRKKCDCVANSSLTPTVPPTPTPTASPLIITLAMAINAQDTPLTQNSITVSLSLYNLTTNTPVSGAPETQSFARTPIPQRQYAANISLTNLAPDKYFIVARRDNMIAKSLFTVTGKISTITVPTTTLVFGDINGDNDINALDYESFRLCYKKTITASSACTLFDFDKNGIIDQIDFNTFVRGWATWNKEGKEL